MTPDGFVDGFGPFRLLQLSLFTFCLLQVASFFYLPSFTCCPSLIPSLSSSLPFTLPPSSQLSSSLPSALRLTLCWMQPEPSSPLLFPGSLSLCFYASLSCRGPQPFSLYLSPAPLPQGVTISSPPWLSQAPTHSFLSHTPKHKYNALTTTYTSTLNAVMTVHHCVCSDTNNYVCTRWKHAWLVGYKHTWENLFSRSFLICIRTPSELTHPAASCVFRTAPSLCSWWGNPTHTHSQSHTTTSWKQSLLLTVLTQGGHTHSRLKNKGLAVLLHPIHIHLIIFQK